LFIIRFLCGAGVCRLGTLIFSFYCCCPLHFIYICSLPLFHFLLPSFHPIYYSPPSFLHLSSSSLPTPNSFLFFACFEFSSPLTPWPHIHSPIYPLHFLNFFIFTHATRLRAHLVDLYLFIFFLFFSCFFLDSLHLDFLYCFYIYTTLFLLSIICLAFFPSSRLFLFILFLYPFFLINNTNNCPL